MGLNYQKCRDKVCENFGKPSCSEIETFKLFFCDLFPLWLKRKDHLLSHKQRVHEGLTFNCEHCPSFSTASKYSLKRHIFLKHTDAKLKPEPKFCKEEGCSFSSFADGSLKRHTESKHEGIVKFKCYVMNCD